MTTRNLSARARSRRRARLAPPAALKQSVAPQPGGPRCARCGRPLSRLPAYLGHSGSAGARFECERCFYPGTGRAPEKGGPVASDRNRWLAEISAGGPVPPSSREDD